MPTTQWRQYNVEFTDPAQAEKIAAVHMVPTLKSGQEAGTLRDWWYIRKRNTWRLRCIPDEPTAAMIGDLLDNLALDGRIVGWATGIYEPETAAFGGPAGMRITHELFHHDSHHLLARAVAPPVIGLARRETSIVLCSAMLRGAGLDWYEQGDAWGKVAELRPTEPSNPVLAEQQTPALAGAMRRLMTVDGVALCGPGGPLAGYRPWIAAFELAGQALAALAHTGQLQRGLRSVLAHQIIFHANRAGLPVVDQSAVAALALSTVFAPSDKPVSRPINPEELPVTTVSQDRADLSADELRAAMTDRLRKHVIRTPAVEAAFRATPRHLFLPGIPQEQAYADNPVYTKTDGVGTSISAASQPTIVGTMLEQLDARPGQRILEIGAGTGYNAALMAAIVGTAGHVTTIDVDADLVDGARAHLATAGIRNVNVILGDGALGHPTSAGYDRIIATVGAWETPTAWLEQLAPDGHLVVPLRLRGTASRSIVFARDRNGWRSIDSQLAVFMPLRGIGDDARRIVALTPELDVTLQVNKDQDVDGETLHGVLDTERHEVWTRVKFAPMVSFEWLELWLACTLDNAIMRMNVQPSAAARGQVTPMFGWGSMATTQDCDLAYLTLRPAEPAADGGKRYEVGVVGHGSSGAALADHTAQQVRIWDEQYRARSVSFEMPTTPPTTDAAAGRFVLSRPNHPVTIQWR